MIKFPMISEKASAISFPKELFFTPLGSKPMAEKLPENPFLTPIPPNIAMSEIYGGVINPSNDGDKTYCDLQECDTM